jgi:hypothetical protein
VRFLSPRPEHGDRQVDIAPLRSLCRLLLDVVNVFQWYGVLYITVKTVPCALMDVKIVVHLSGAAALPPSSSAVHGGLRTGLVCFLELHDNLSPEVIHLELESRSRGKTRTCHRQHLFKWLILFSMQVSSAEAAGLWHIRSGGIVYMSRDWHGGCSQSDQEPDSVL